MGGIPGIVPGQIAFGHNSALAGAPSITGGILSICSSSLGNLKPASLKALPKSFSLGKSMWHVLQLVPYCRAKTGIATVCSADMIISKAISAEHQTQWSLLNGPPDISSSSVSFVSKLFPLHFSTASKGCIGPLPAWRVKYQPRRTIGSIVRCRWQPLLAKTGRSRAGATVSRHCASATLKLLIVVGLGRQWQALHYDTTQENKKDSRKECELRQRHRLRILWIACYRQVAVYRGSIGRRSRIGDDGRDRSRGPSGPMERQVEINVLRFVLAQVAKHRHPASGKHGRVTHQHRRSPGHLLRELWQTLPPDEGTERRNRPLQNLFRIGIRSRGSVTDMAS